MYNEIISLLLNDTYSDEIVIKSSMVPTFEIKDE